MTAEQFTYWLQGFLEISEETTLDTRQLNVVRDHLDLVFNKITPSYKFTKAEDLNPPTPIWFNPNQTLC